MSRTSRPHLGLIFVALLLSMGVAALDSTIVSTAMPTIISELGGFRDFSWVFSSYLLTYTATIPIYGRLADIYGRKPMLLVALVLFLAGSALSGASTSMTALILFRGLQGLGAGGVLPMANTIVGDLFTLEERARLQGWLSSVWGIAAIVGPSLGGVLVLASWRLVFLINLPIGLAAIAIIGRYYRDEGRLRTSRMDIVGSALLLVWVSLLIVGMLEGSAWGWGSVRTVLVLAAGVVGLLAFLAHQSRSPAPVFPLRLLRNPVIGVGDAVTFLVGGLSIGLSAFIPTFVQGVDGMNPTVAGAVLTTMSIGWPLASGLSGRLLLRVGARRVGLLGGLCAMAGTGLLLTLGLTTPVWHIPFFTFLTGAGLGFTSTTAIVLIQDAVAWEERGVATGSNMFARMLGSTLFVSAMGAVLNAGMARRLPGSGALLNELLSPGAHVLGRTLAAARVALAASLHGVYVFGFVLACLLLLLEFAFPDVGRRPRPERASDAA